MEMSTITMPKVLADALITLGIAKVTEKKYTIADIQRALNEHFDAQLEVDGKLGPKTSAAIRRAEEFLKLPVDGVPGLGLYEALEILDGLVFDFTPPAKSEGGLPTTDFEALKEEYQRRWDACKITNPKAVQAACASLLANRARYEAIMKINGVPWEDISVVHRMECGGRFDRHLHNGDPLTARTVQVPAGRPKTGTPPFTWEFSALDALERRAQNKDWSIPRRLWIWEGYNGWGYRSGAGKATTPACTSAYLWAGTDQYIKGKYVADGKFDPNAVSKQIGIVALLKGLGVK